MTQLQGSLLANAASFWPGGKLPEGIREAYLTKALEPGIQKTNQNRITNISTLVGITKHEAGLSLSPGRQLWTFPSPGINDMLHLVFCSRLRAGRHHRLSIRCSIPDP